MKKWGFIHLIAKYFSIFMMWKTITLKGVVHKSKAKTGF